MFIFTLLLKSKLDTISLFYGILNALEHYRTIERFKLLIFNNIMIGQDLFKQRDGALSGHFPKFAVSLLFPSFPYFFFNFIGLSLAH